MTGRNPVVSLYVSAPGSRFWAAGSGLDLEDALARAATLGYDAVELMPRDVDDPAPEALRDLADRHGLQVLCLATGFIALERGLTLTHPDREVRRQAVRAVQACLRSAWHAGARFVSVGLVRGKLPPGASPREAREHLTASVRECGMTAGELELLLLVEPGNRYETDFIHTVEEGVALVKEVDLPSVRLLADTFHMNIEETSLPDALRRGSAYLAHLHLADSNRRAPGWGHLDFPAVAAALREIGYDGALGVEMLMEPDFDAAARQALQFVRRIFQLQAQ